MSQVVLINQQGDVVEQGDSSLYQHWQQQDRLSIWVNFLPEEMDEMTHFLEHFEANEFVQHDVVRTKLPPKIERFDDSILFILRGIVDPPNLVTFESVQISALLGSNWLITYQHRFSPSVQQTFLDATNGRCATHCSGLVIRLLQILSKRYIDWMLNVDAVLAEAEEQLFNQPEDSILELLVNYKKTLRHLKRSFMYHDRLAQNLNAEGLFLDYEQGAPELNDLAIKFERLKTLVDLYYDQMNDLIEGYISISSHRLNHTMRILTVITAIFVPLSFLAGLYGMNFENMPELKWKYSYFILMSFMGITALSLIRWFKTQKWL